MSMSADSHPMLIWADENGMTVEDIATEASCSPSHLRNVFAGRKEASLRLAHRLSEISGFVVPMAAFLRPEEARA